MLAVSGAEEKEESWTPKIQEKERGSGCALQKRRLNLKKRRKLDKMQHGHFKVNTHNDFAVVGVV